MNKNSNFELNYNLPPVQAKEYDEEADKLDREVAAEGQSGPGAGGN